MSDAKLTAWKGFPIAEQKAGRIIIHSWPRLLLFDLFLLATLILATRVATFLHEFMGHALAAAAMGGHVSAIRVTLLGGGKVSYHFERELVSSGLFLVAMGGIIVNIATGIVPFVVPGRLRKQPGWGLFLILFGMVSLLGAVAYCALGFYYEVGDPAKWIQGPSPGGGWLWVPFLVGSPIVSYAVMKTYFILSDGWFPADGLAGRIAVMALTLGVASFVYAGLYGLTSQRSVALDAPLLAYQRAEKGVRESKAEELNRKLRQAHPGLPETEIQRIARRNPIPVRPDEVSTKFPLKPVIAFLYAGGALFALRTGKREVPEMPGHIAPESAILVIATASALMGLLAWTDGWIYSERIVGTF